MRRLGLVILVALIAFTASARARSLPAGDGKRTRPTLLRCGDCAGVPLLTMIDRALVQSATLRALVAHLDEADVIVYLRIVDSLPRETCGRTRLVGASSGWRYLSIDLSDRLSGVDLLSILGHELQHAVEIADAGVLDQPSLVDLYERISATQGVNGLVAGRWFETAAAIAIGRRVRSELASFD